MAIVHFPIPARIKSIQWTLDRPAQINVSGYTGKRTVVANPWYGKWTASVELASMSTSMVREWRAFLASVKGQINTFALPAAEEGAYNSNTGVTVASTAASGAVTMTVAGVVTALEAGNFITVDNQLLMLTKVAGNALTFEPPLRIAATAGTVVQTSEPYAMVAMTASTVWWATDLGPVYGISFEVEEVMGIVGAPYYLNYALALDFDDGRYAVNGTGYSALSSVPGYTYTRSGEKAEQGSSGSPITYAANVPGIPTAVGYWARQAFTNLLLNAGGSGNLSTQSVTVAAVAHTLSFIGTGTVTLSGVSTAGPLVGTSANNRVKLTFTPTAGSLTLTVTGTVQYAGLVAASKEGPIIPTAGAAATVGGDLLHTNIKSDGSALVAQDMLIWATGTPESFSDYQRLFQLDDGAGTSQLEMIFIPGALPRVFVSATAFDGVSAAIAGDEITLLAYRNQTAGTWRGGMYRGGALTWFGAATVLAFPASMTKARPGCYVTTGNALRGALKGAFILPGTFATDASVIAAITGAV